MEIRKGKVFYGVLGQDRTGRFVVEMGQSHELRRVTP